MGNWSTKFSKGWSMGLNASSSLAYEFELYLSVYQTRYQASCWMAKWVS